MTLKLRMIDINRDVVRSLSCMNVENLTADIRLSSRDTLGSHRNSVLAIGHRVRSDENTLSQHTVRVDSSDRIGVMSFHCLARWSFLKSLSWYVFIYSSYLWPDVYDG